MATILAQTIIDRAGIILQDTTNVRWPESELLGWLNDAHREIVLLKPDSYSVNESFSLAAGTRQEIPAAGIQLIDVVRNLGTDGLTPGDAITPLPRMVLDNSRRSWHTETQVVPIEHFCFDDKDPRRWYNYPPCDGTGQVEIVYSATPTEIAIGAAIKLEDVYSNAILDFVLYRAYSKDAEFTANQGRANSAYTSFLRSLGMKMQAEKEYDPDKSDG